MKGNSEEHKERMRARRERQDARESSKPERPPGKYIPAGKFYNLKPTNFKTGEPRR